MNKIDRIWKLAFAIASVILLFLIAFQSVSEYSRIESNWNYQDSIYILNQDIEHLKQIIENERINYNNIITTGSSDMCTK